MNLSALEAVLLASFSIPIIMKYRILPVTGTPYWMFGIIFLLLIINILFSIYFNQNKINVFNKIKNILVGILLTLVLGGVMWTAIADRGKNAPGQNDNVHDIVLQLEAALRYLGQNRNPYAETYFGTPMESWHYAENGIDTVNPALYHFVMPPWYLLFPYPFYYVSMRTLGYFDARMPLLFCIIGLAFSVFFLFRKPDIGRLAVVLVLFNPATIDYLIEGRSDFFGLFWLVLAILLLKFNKYFLASVIMSLAIMSKQTIWFMTPIYFGYLWLSLNKSWQKVIFYAAVTGVIVIGLCLPFILWNPIAFFNSVIFYLSGNTAHGYPISGYGFGMLLYEFKIIKSIHAYFPFVLWQSVLGGLILTVGFILIKKYLTLSRVIILHAISLFVFWYFSRYFNNSHMAYITTLFLLGILLNIDENYLGYENNSRK
jgi:hypothetical protein